MEFPESKELDIAHRVLITEERLARSLTAWANDHGSKSRTFATFYLATLFGIYALLAMTLNIIFANPFTWLVYLTMRGWFVDYWSLLNLLFYTLMAIAAYFALHAFWYASLSTKAIQWLQTLNSPTPSNAVSIENFLIDGGGRSNVTPVMFNRLYRGFRATRGWSLPLLFSVTFLATLAFGYNISLMLEVLTFGALVFPGEYPWFLIPFASLPWSMSLAILIVFFALAILCLVVLYGRTVQKHSAHIRKTKDMVVEVLSSESLPNQIRLWKPKEPNKARHGE